MCAKLLQSCPTLCDPVDSSPPGSSVHGILQARILQWVAVSFFRDLSDPGVEAAPLTSPAVVGGFLTTSITWEGLYWGRHRIKKLSDNCKCYEKNRSEMMVGPGPGPLSSVGEARGGQLFNQDVPRRHLYGGDV